MVNVIDYIPGTTLLHAPEPLVKLALAAAIIASTLLANTYAALIGLLVLTFALAAYVRAARRLASLAEAACPRSPW